MLWGILALALVLGIYLLLNRKKEGAVTTELAEFSVDDTEKISKVRIHDRSGEGVELKKDEDGIWWVNAKYPAFKPYMDLFLNKTLKRIKVKGPVAKTAKDNVIRSMASQAIKVEIFEGDKAILSYYLGDHTPDMKGTYMHLEGAETPFITYIPGFDGYISPKFSLNEEDWFSHSIFDYTPESIRQISLINHRDSSSSFVLKKHGGAYVLEPNNGGRLGQQQAKSYFALFKFKNFEGYPDYLSSEQEDSILNSKPMITLKVLDAMDNERVLKVYPKGGESNTLVDQKGNVLTYDPERYFASFTGFDRLVTIQEYTFGKLFAKHSDFLE